MPFLERVMENFAPGFGTVQEGRTTAWVKNGCVITPEPVCNNGMNGNNGRTAGTVPMKVPFAGWFSPDLRTAWTRLAENATYAEALGRRIDATAAVRWGDTLVTRAGVGPNRSAPKYCGRRRML